MDEIKVERDGEDPERRKNIRRGAATLLALMIVTVTVIVAIPLVAGLYRWAFGG